MGFRASPVLALLFITACLSGCVQETLEPVTQDLLVLDEPVRNCVDRNPLKNPYFGDTHVHTSYSLDAYNQDNRLTPFDAYDFAKGGTVDVAPYNSEGTALRNATLDRPLDFTLLSDHAEFLGDRALCMNPDTKAYKSPTCALFRSQSFESNIIFNFLLSQPQTENPLRMPHCGENGENCRDHAITLWQEIQRAAEEAYDRSDECQFTSFIGYEWSGSPGRYLTTIQNLHRNVMFANANVPELPIGYLTEAYPEGLWEALQTQCLNAESEGGDSCDVLTIPHNSNVSNGIMFEQFDKNNNPFDDDYLNTRAFFEPIAEIIQHKGNSECMIGRADEECNFDKVPWGHLAGNVDISILAQVDPIPSSFLRNALKEGLAYQSDKNKNPFKYGFIGSTDSHIGTPGLVREIDYLGHGGAGNLGEVAEVDPTVFNDDPEHNPGGLAVVWAEQNTRTDLFNAMRNREVYATSGPRHILRFFGGDEYPLDACEEAESLVQTGYDHGVPMGGDLSVADGKTPKFIVSALKDSGSPLEPGVDLQRIQLVKGWLDANNERHETVLDIAGDPDNGAYVNEETCATIGTGATNLCTVWEDKNFDPSQHAFYYTRVIENPSCRWTKRQCIKAGVSCFEPESIPEGMEACCDGSVPTTHQERSWSSPIWYTPENS